VGGAAAAGVVCAAQPEVFAPRGGRDLRIERVGGGGEALFGVGEAVGGDQRFGGDEGGLQRVRRRRAGAENLVGEMHRVLGGSAAQREAGAEHAHRPFVPAARLPA